MIRFKSITKQNTVDRYVVRKMKSGIYLCPCLLCRWMRLSVHFANALPSLVRIIFCCTGAPFYKFRENIFVRSGEILRLLQKKSTSIISP
jgi:hypothetical protein